MDFPYVINIKIRLNMLSTHHYKRGGVEMYQFSLIEFMVIWGRVPGVLWNLLLVCQSVTRYFLQTEKVEWNCLVCLANKWKLLKWWCISLCFEFIWCSVIDSNGMKNLFWNVVKCVCIGHGCKYALLARVALTPPPM